MMLFLSLILATTILQVGGACPSGTITGSNGICYKAFPQAAPWYQAESNCYQTGGHLASITSAFTNSLIAGIADASFQSTVDYWTGGTTNFLNGVWAWSDFNQFTYTNWAINQPINQSGYCSTQRKKDAQWTSQVCTLSKPYICEYIASNTSSISTQPCPNNNWFYSNLTAKCYLPIKYQAITWSTASSHCQNDYNASLLTIHSYAENLLVAGYTGLAFGMDKKGADDLWVWIGLGDPNNNGNYQWVDNSVLDFVFWDRDPCGASPNQPTLNGTGAALFIENYPQNYVIDCDYTYGHPLTWFTPTDSSFVNGYVCELKIGSF